MKNYNGPIYGNSNRFQFILEFSNQSGLSDISVRQRVILSAYLTALTKGITGNKKNLFDLVFNFDQTIRKDKITKTTYYEKFITDLSALLLKKPDLFPYIKNNAEKLNERGKTVIYRSQIDQNEYSLIRQSKNTYQSFMTKLYMIGVSKNNRITKLNNISIFEFSKDKINVSRVRKLADKFLKEAGLDSDLFDSKNKMFQFYRNKKSGKQTKTEKVDKIEEIAEQYSEYKAPIIPEDSKISDNVISENMEEVEQMAEEYEDDQGAFDFENVTKVDDMIKKYDERPQVYLDLGEQKRFSSDLFDRAISYEDEHPGYFGEKFEKAKTYFSVSDIQDLNRQLVDDGKFSINSMLKDYCNLAAVLKGGDLGQNWKQIKDAARTEQVQLKELLANKFTKIYDKDIAIYWYVVWFILKNHKKALRGF